MTQALAVVEYRNWSSVRDIVRDTIIFKRNHAHGTAFTVYSLDAIKLYGLPCTPVWLQLLDQALDEWFEESLLKEDAVKMLGAKGLEKGRNAHRKWWRFEKIK
jgi:hypothetical protein